MNWNVYIAPLRGLVLGFNYYNTSHEEWYNPETDDYYEHYTVFLFIVAIRVIKE